jgi:ribonuclease P protein component
MFPRRSRLSREAFPRVLKSGVRITLPHLSLAVSREVVGYAVVVPKQVARLSTTRHRLKRQITACLRTHKLPMGLVVFARAGLSQLPPAEMRAELEAGLKRIA